MVVRFWKQWVAILLARSFAPPISKVKSNSAATGFCIQDFSECSSHSFFVVFASVLVSVINVYDPSFCIVRLLSENAVLPPRFAELCINNIIMPFATHMKNIFSLCESNKL
jgi:hypothetical protein